MTHGDTLRKGYHDLLRREILDLIPPTAKSILDLGCGTGTLGRALKQRQNCCVHGIELSKDAAQVARENLNHVWCDNLNRFDPIFIKQKYDTLIFADILEHLISPWRCLKKFLPVLTDDGVVIASIPNVAHPWITSNLKKGLFRYEPAGILDITHLRFFTKTSIFQLFYMAGLKIIDIRAHPSDKNPTQYLITAIKMPVAVRKPAALILILTFNEWIYTKRCLDSIKKHTHTPYKILVIDNGSTDETVAELRKDHSIYHIENSCNLGFSKGFNIGLAVVDTPYFVIANSDTVVTEYWLASLIYHIGNDPDLMLLGTRTNHVSGPQKIKNAAYTDDKSLDEYAETLKKHEEPDVTYCPRIVFFFTLFKAEVLKRVGYFDEIFEKGNYEDDDYCMRVRAKKLKTAYCNTVFIHHFGSRTFVGNKMDFAACLKENKEKFFKKWHLTEYFGLTLEDK